ncbi:MAG: CHAT domain-containing protein [Xenococcaceae cyanobacterium]
MNLAGQLMEAYGNTSDSQQDFLMQLLQATSDSGGKAEAVYPLLKANLDKVDENLGRTLKVWAEATLPGLEKEQKQVIAADIYNFSNRIGEFPLNKPVCMEIALAGYQIALTVYTRERFPVQWAMTQNNLGNAYGDRIAGERRENLELAIACYREALKERTREHFPVDWAMTQYNLGIAYGDRIAGERKENLELAIACYREALKERTRDRFPVQWAMTQYNLGNAYRNRIGGERRENIEQAIACYSSALKERTRDRFPVDWAATQNNLGNAYNTIIAGDRRENIEIAIACFSSALKECTRDRFPVDWAATQNNLGIAYSYRIAGERRENIEKAIACYSDALKERTRERFPVDWAQTQNNLGIAYSKRIAGERRENIELAIQLFQSALEVITPTTLPLGGLRTGRNLGNTAFTVGLWHTAIQGYSAAIEAVEQSRAWATTEERRQEILAQSIGIYEKMVQSCINNKQLNKALEYVEPSRSKRLVDLMASNDAYSDAEIPPQVQEYLDKYHSLQQQINAIRFGNQGDSKGELATAGSTRSRAKWKEDNQLIQDLETQKQETWETLRRLDPVLAGEQQVSAPNLAAMQQLIDSPTTALLSFYTISDHTYIFVLTQDKITCHTCAEQGRKSLQIWIVEQWISPYVLDKPAWRNGIQQFLESLAQRLLLNQLIADHLQDITELILVPHLYLHLIPLTALPIEGGKRLGDQFLIRTVPSCQVLEFCKNRPPIADQQYGTVEDATEDLPCASFECEQIAQMYSIPEEFRLRGRTFATTENYPELVKKVQTLHSSHHAQSRLDKPLESALLLGDGTITLGQLFYWRFPQLNEVFLSCCETGLGLSKITDDILTLAAGFLCAGARSVISTLWSVDDLATALFSIFYYQSRQGGNSRPRALQEAQKRLRSLTGEELRENFGPQIQRSLEERKKEAWKAHEDATKKRDSFSQGSPDYNKWEEERKELQKFANKIRKKIDKAKNNLEHKCYQEFPFADLVYWSAFTCQGLS